MVGSPVKRYFEKQGYRRGRSLFCYDTDVQKNYKDDVSRADVIFVCVPSPKNSDGSCNTSLVEAVISKFSHHKKVIVVKSTVEPGTVVRLQQKYECPILFNPEFLTESRAWEDFIKPDRQIVAHTQKSLPFSSSVLGILPQAYFTSPGSIGAYQFYRLNSSEAEMAKYASNIFGALKVSYANIIADYCSALEKQLAKEKIKEEIDYQNVRQAIACDSRIGDAWLDVDHGQYRGFGGYCLPKDMAAFIAFGKKLAKGLKKNDPDKKLISAGLKVVEAIWGYNQELLKSQDLTIDQVSSRSYQEADKK